MGIWQQTRKMNSVIAVQSTFSCEREDATEPSGQRREPHSSRAASREVDEGERWRAYLERDLAIGLRHLWKHVQDGLHERQKAQLTS